MSAMPNKKKDPDEISCARCIHKKMCIARMAIDEVVKTWNEQYPYVIMQTDGDKLALNCTSYQTLTDIHVIQKEKDETEPYHDPKKYYPSGHRKLKLD